jgi:hypothetical protein
MWKDSFTPAILRNLNPEGAGWFLFLLGKFLITWM